MLESRKEREEEVGGGSETGGRGKSKPSKKFGGREELGCHNDPPFPIYHTPKKGCLSPLESLS
jgi:hypothetical protein